MNSLMKMRPRGSKGSNDSLHQSDQEERYWAELTDTFKYDLSTNLPLTGYSDLSDKFPSVRISFHILFVV